MAVPHRKDRILAVHSGALGDCVLFGHLLSRLGGDVPNGRGSPPICLVARGEIAGLLEGLGRAHRSLDFDALPIQEIFGDDDLNRCELPRLLGPHDKLISCFATGNRVAEGRLAAVCGAQTACFLPVRPAPECGAHLLDLWCDMLGMAPQAGPPHPWPVPAEWTVQARQALAALGIGRRSRYYVIHPGAGSPAKCWPLESFAALAGRLGSAVIVLGPVEADLWPDEAIAALAGRLTVLKCPSLKTLAGVLAGAAGYVGNDSGVSHLAAALGSPAVALFGPTRPEHFAPIGARTRVVSSAGLADITVQDVLAALDQFARPHA